MAIAESFAGDYNKVHYYQGVLIVEVALTLILYLILKIIHYIKWGHDEQAAKDESAPKPAEEETESRKWDQKSWNVYFSIIFTFHIGAISLIIIYIPYIFSAVIGFLHFVAFVALIILNIFIKDAEQGNGSRTKGSRVVWGIMCLFNLMLIIGGLSGVSKVYNA